MNLTKAAAFLSVSTKTLRLAAEIEAEHPLADGPWLFRRAILEGKTGQRITDQVRRRHRHPAGPTNEQKMLF